MYAVDGNCSACNTTSPYVDNYINFANELIKTFQTYANQEGSVLQTEWNSNPNNELQWIVDSLNQKAQATASSVYVLWLVTTETALLDSWKSIAPMMNGKAILRDWEKIDTVWQSITNTLLDLGNNGVFQRLWFRQGRDERIEEILRRYSNMGDNAPITYTLWDWKLYSQPRDILGALRSMNQALKTTIGIWTNNIIDNSDNKFLWWVITFSKQAQDTLLTYYTCARWTAWITCSETWERAKENLENTRKETTDKTKDAKKIITDALKRLSWFWSNNGWAKEMLKQRTNELLRAEYWRQWVRNNQWETIWQWLKNGLNNAFWFKETRKTLKNDTAAIWPFAWLKQVNKKVEWEQFIIGDRATQKIIQENKSTLRAAFDSVRDTAKDNWKESVYADVSSVTKLFPMITSEVVSAKNVIDGTQKESLVQNLGQACELQCSNLWWKCRY